MLKTFNFQKGIGIEGQKVCKQVRDQRSMETIKGSSVIR